MDRLEPLGSYAQALSPAQWCQAFYLVSAAGILVLQLLPREERKALMDYGARRPKDGGEQTSQKQAEKEDATKQNTGFLLLLTSYGQVPHAWFLHFYILCVSWSVFWAWQYFHGSSMMRAMAGMQSRAGHSSDVAMSRTAVAWLLMHIQGLRRLYESLFVTKPGSTPMWFVHWLLGLAYYTAMNVSVWIEASDAILRPWELPTPAQFLTPRTVIGAIVFLTAGLQQSRCHRYLAGLKKYTLPSEGLFRFIACPHYTYECLIYLSLAFVAAPPGSTFNRTVLCGVVFVAVNLGATAYGTKQWYAEKFGADKVAARWRMIPFVF